MEGLIAALDALYTPCQLCEVRCGARRAEGELGDCGLRDKAYAYNELMHLGEEAELIPSYTIFLSGCNLACSFCSEKPHLTPPFEGRPFGDPSSVKRVAKALRRYRKDGLVAKNINFVGGEPSLVLPAIARFAQALQVEMATPPPLLLNTNGYLTPDALKASFELFPQFVVDLKFGNDACALKVGGRPHYTKILKRNLEALHREVGLRVSTLYVRHLLMPGHLSCCTEPVLKMLSALPNARVNMMPAFFPFSDGPQTWKPLDDTEKTEGLRLLRASGIRRAYYDGKALGEGTVP